MKTHHSIMLDVSRQFAWDCYADAACRTDWERDLSLIEPVSGQPGQVGAVSRISISGDHWLETVTENRAPDFRAAISEGETSRFLTVDRFESIGESTRWSRWQNTSFRGLARITSVFRVGQVRARIVDDMERFKLLVESRWAERTQ